MRQRFFLIFAIIFLLSAANVWAAEGFLKIFDGTDIVEIATEPAGTLTSPLRIANGGTIYGIVLVDIGDSNASKIRIKTNSGIRALSLNSGGITCKFKGVTYQEGDRYDYQCDTCSRTYIQCCDMSWRNCYECSGKGRGERDRKRTETWKCSCSYRQTCQ